MSEQHTKEPWRYGLATTRGVTGPRAAPGVFLDGRGVVQMPIYVDGDDCDLPVAWVLSTDQTDDLTADARRIVACVNACEGLDTDALERFGLGSEFGSKVFQADRQRDELLRALKNAVDALDMYHAYGWADRAGVRMKARAAIARAQGEAK